MQLVEILLPFMTIAAKPSRPKKYAEIRQQLTERFGDWTAFARSPPRALRLKCACRCTTRSSYN